MAEKILTKVVSLKCDPTWVAAIDVMAQRCGLTRSALIRRTVDGVRLVEHPEPGYHELAVQIAKLGTLYNQTVRLAHQTQHRTGGMPVAELLDRVESHRRTLQLMLQVLLDHRQGGGS